MKILLAFVLLGLGVTAKAAPAESSDVSTIINQTQEQRFKMAKGKDDVSDAFNKWAPVNRLIVEYTVTITTAVAAGSGVVDGFCVSSGAAGDYGVLLDTTTTGVNSVNGLASIAALAGTETAQSIVIARQPTEPYGSPTVGRNAGCMDFETPLPFKAGLFVQMSAAHSIAVVRYRQLRR